MLSNNGFTLNWYIELEINLPSKIHAADAKEQAFHCKPA